MNKFNLFLIMSISALFVTASIFGSTVTPALAQGNDTGEVEVGQPLVSSAENATMPANNMTNATTPVGDSANNMTNATTPVGDSANNMTNATTPVGDSVVSGPSQVEPPQNLETSVSENETSVSGDEGSEGGDEGSEGGDEGSEGGDEGSEGGDEGSEGGDEGSEGEGNN
jgi:hypothetical protein